MKWHTELNPELHSQRRKIDYTNTIVFMGSCFSENIGNKLSELSFNTTINPLGISYNPISLFKQIEYLSQNKRPTVNEFYPSPKGIVHFDFHGNFTFDKVEEGVKKLNTSLDESESALKRASHVFLTLGSAIVFRHQKFGIVNNCHKVNQDQFEKRVLTFKEVQTSVEKIIEHIKQLNPTIKIVFTVSPVRHIRHGLSKDRRSKSLLISALHEVIDSIEDCVYFPSYEMITDDLRDYRFYKEDLIHPNQQGIDYIWDCFSKLFFSSETQTLIKEVQSVMKGLNHKPLNPESPKHQQFLSKLNAKIEVLKTKGIVLERE